MALRRVVAAAAAVAVRRCGLAVKAPAPRHGRADEAVANEERAEDRGRHDNVLHQRLLLVPGGDPAGSSWYLVGIFSNGIHEPVEVDCLIVKANLVYQLD